MKPLLISFSGGKSSAFMTIALLEQFPSREKIVVFANTGKEREETLNFVSQCDQSYGMNVVWVEAKVNPEHRKGTVHTITKFESACRSGEPFEAVIQKYGIPSRAFPHCTRELKQRPIHNFARSIGWRDYETAIGIRADEAHRASVTKLGSWNLIYPLVDMGVTKQDVNNFWLRQPFTLNLQEHEGNCDFCWKKSDKKLFVSINEGKSDFNWWKDMERSYQDAGNRPHGGGRNFFFRGNRSGIQIEQLAREVGLNNSIL